MSDNRTEVTTLSNGFRVVTEHMPHVGSAAVGVWVSAGSRHETPEEAGLSHMLEHMAFKGTNTRSAKRIAEEIEDVGGDHNAYTDYESTAYHARVLAEHTPLAVELLADILRDSVFDPGEIEKERQVILQEIAERRDMPGYMAMETLQEASFPDQPLGRPVIGNEDAVNSFDRNAIRAYMDRSYGPDQMILGAVGLVDHDAVVRDAERLFGDMTARATPAMEPGRYDPRAVRIVKDVEQAHIALGFPGPDNRDLEARMRAMTFANVLGGGMSSRLFQEAREERGLCYSIFSYTDGFADAGSMTIYAATSAENSREMATLALETAERAAEDASEQEVARARAQAKAGLVMSLESPMRRAESLVREVALRGEPTAFERRIEQIDAIDVAAVREAGRTMLEGDAPAAVYYGPEAGGLPDLSYGRA